MPPKGKRRLSETLQQEEERKLRLKLEHSAALEKLREERAAREQAEDEKESYLAAKRAGDLIHRPSYYPTYAAGDNRASSRASTPKDETGQSVELWPEPRDGNQIGEASRFRLLNGSRIRLSPPRTNDWRRVSAYESIGITSEDLDRDRKERHQEKANALIETYQRFNFDSVETEGRRSVTCGNILERKAKKGKRKEARRHNDPTPQSHVIIGISREARAMDTAEQRPLRSTSPIIKAEPADSSMIGLRDIATIEDIIEQEEDNVVNPYSHDFSPPQMSMMTTKL